MLAMEAIRFLGNLLSSFVLGLLTPLTAVCVLPLYPGFLAYLSTKLSGQKDDRKLLALFGVVVTLGVIVFMMLIGLLFTTLLQISLTNVISVVSPIAFGLLLLISILLIFNVAVGKFLPRYQAPEVGNPLFSAFVFGFFFGAIVIPCNPLFIAVLFTRSLTVMNYVTNLLNFLMFGMGIGFPLLLFSLISGPVSNSIIAFLTAHKRIINQVAGVFMLGVSVYYLVFVFRIFG